MKNIVLLAVGLAIFIFIIGCAIERYQVEAEFITATITKIEATNTNTWLVYYEGKGVNYYVESADVSNLKIGMCERVLLKR